MRVTQSMLSNNMLHNLSSSYNRMGKLQEQINTQKKVNRPSDDPVTVMKSLGYGMTVDKVGQFQKNLGEVNNWLDSSDDALNGVGEVLQRTRELIGNALNTGAMTPDDRNKIKIELEQMQQQLHDLANTKVGDKYIFSGTKTDTPLYDSVLKKYPDVNDLEALQKDVEIEVFDGVNLRVNTKAVDSFMAIDQLFLDLNKKVDGTGEYDDKIDFSEALTKVDKLFDTVLTNRSDIGARSNRAELMGNRLEMQEGAAKKQRSENEDVDLEVAITNLITAETIHRAALSVGARIIQPSLVDFLR